jgi:ubiquinone/menaquinone biosynthesis C-methylase UbiE
MENEEEAMRLDLKTDQERLEQQAKWAGIRPGMRVIDVGCGSGKTSCFLHQLVQPGGQVVGIDASINRIDHAIRTYKETGIDYVCRDFYASLDDLGQFDFAWVRFVLEYHRQQAVDIVKNLIRILRPGGILCLIDLDHNCLNHYGMPARLEKAMAEIMGMLEANADFDPFMGRKLYSFLYDLGCEKIDVQLAAHHLIIGQLNDVDAYNWLRKVEVAVQGSGYDFPEYAGGFREFREEFQKFFADPRRFTYTPLIACRGIKP